MNPLLLVDSYKIHHHRMYNEGTSMIYSNLTPRKSRLSQFNGIIVFGVQHFIKTYLIDLFQKEFFNKSWPELDAEYKRHNLVDTTHIQKLWSLGYLPLKIKALEEGSFCPIGVPCLTIRNTHPDHFWLVNYLETLLSCSLWQSITSATIAEKFYGLLSKWAMKTTGTTEGVQWQGHDFSMRGMSSVESAVLSGMGHLTSFTGTDTIPAIYQLEKSYNATGLIGASVPATEHSVMCMGTKDDEIGTFRRLLGLYPTGILSVVSDTWDLWAVLTKYLPQLKEEILARDGKLVIRPDSGDPVDIICGTNQVSSYKDHSHEAKTVEDFVGDMYMPDYLEDEENEEYFFIFQGKTYKAWSVGTGRFVEYGHEERENEYEEVIAEGTPAEKGVIELLWEVFGGTVNEQGYKVLDPHIGAIYGDSITLERAEQICARLEAKGFASSNMVFGIGSYTYQYNTRDTFGFLQ